MVNTYGLIQLKKTKTQVGKQEQWEICSFASKKIGVSKKLVFHPQMWKNLKISEKGIRQVLRRAGEPWWRKKQHTHTDLVVVWLFRFFTKSGNILFWQKRLWWFRFPILWCFWKVRFIVTSIFGNNQSRISLDVSSLFFVSAQMPGGWKNPSQRGGCSRADGGTLTFKRKNALHEVGRYQLQTGL